MKKFRQFDYDYTLSSKNIDGYEVHSSYPDFIWGWVKKFRRKEKINKILNNGNDSNRML